MWEAGRKMQEQPPGGADAGCQGAFDVGGVEDEVRRAGGADDDIGGGQVFGQGVEVDGAAAQGRGQPLGPVVGAVGDQHAAQPGAHERLPRDAAHLPRADQQRGAVGQRPERFLRHLDDDRRHREGQPADLRLSAHPFAGLDRGPEERGQHRPGDARRVCDFECRLHLPQDLVFAGHQRIQPGGHAQQMARRVVAAVGEEVLVQRRIVEAAPAGQIGPDDPLRVPRRRPRRSRCGCTSRGWRPPARRHRTRTHPPSAGRAARSARRAAAPRRTPAAPAVRRGRRCG